MTRMILVGPGRAGTALALAAVDAGHTVTGVLARSEAAATTAARALGANPLGWDEPLPSTELLLVAVRDDAITPVAARLAPWSGEVDSAVHLSGFHPVAALAPLEEAGVAIGALHPLQTLPDPTLGRRALAGAWMAVTASGPLHRSLTDLVVSLGAHPFDLDDRARRLYHAGAAAAANYVITVLELARRLLTEAGVPLEAARPLVEAVVANAFDLGPGAALTGPIARGDLATVRGQLEAVADRAPELLGDFLALARATARLAGTSSLWEEVLA